jgi:dTDP-4-dehydrorhamnose 3,5-epimerase
MFESERIKSIPLQIEGVFGLITRPKDDSRGSLTRLWEENFIQSEFSIKQISITNNPTRLTLRGMHYQKSPYLENKIIYCNSGKIFEVVLDIRKDSQTYAKHLTVETGSTSEFQGLVVPSGCAHGYMTLETNCSLIYFIDNVYSAESARGILWNDPNLNIKWPSKPSIISEKDLSWPLLKSL